MKPLDINLLPLVRRAGQDQASLPGLYAVNPPRRAARGRSEDELIIYLTFTGGAPWSNEQQSQLLARTAQVYYDTPGAVTTASRTALEFLNQNLLERNLRSDGGQRQGAGWFTLAVVHAGRLYLTQAGQMRVFLLTSQGSQELSDPESSGPGLGLARPPKLRYSQVELVPEAYVLITPILPPAWQQSGLQGVYSQGLESMRRRLLAQAGTDLAAVLIQTQTGKGKMRLLWPKTTTAAVVATPRSAEPITPLPSSQEPPGITDQPQDMSAAAGDSALHEESSAETQPAANEPTPAATPAEVATPPTPSEPATVTIPDTTPLSPLPQEPIPSRRLNDQPATRPPRRNIAGVNSPALEKIKQIAKSVRSAFGHALQVMLQTTGRLLKRILPDENLFNLPPGVMIFLAVAVPLIVVVIAVTIFQINGRKELVRAHYADALVSAQQARAQGEPGLQRVAWEKTLHTIARAEKFDQKNADIQALKLEANTALDQLNKVQRLIFQPALTDPLNQSLNIIQLIATQDELYLLTDAQGSVLRALQTGSGYKPDLNFNCGPGMYGTRAVGRLVDILALPPGSEFNATILGMDSNANLLYCLPHERPKAIGLATPTAAGWGKTAQFALDIDNKNLYVLDPVKRNVWIYERLLLNNQPIPFFDQTIDQLPPLDDVVDMAVNRATIYLLHNNGQTTLCEFGRLAGSPSRCQSPINYQDDRLGQSGGPTIDGALFSTIQYAPPPDPSIFMLNPETQAIYQFGLLQLNFYYQYRPRLTDNPIPAKPATAFAISPSRTAFLAVGSEVYQAKIIP